MTLKAKKHTLGIMVDGRDLRIAHLGWQGGEITIFSIDQITMPHRLGKAGEPDITVEQEGESAFGLESDTSVTNGFGEELEGDVSGVLVSLLGKYPMKKLQLAVNIPDNQVSFHQFKDDFGLKGKALLQRLRSAINLPASDRSEDAMLDVFKSPDGGLTAVAFGGNIPLVETLLDIRSFLPGGKLRFAAIEANEIALVNLARVTLDLTAGETNVLVHIGRESSNLIVLKGDRPPSFQTIHQGYSSEKVCNTLFSRILLEQEESDVPEINRIILAGEIGLTRATEFFTKQFPEVEVKPIAVDPLNTSQISADDLAFLPKFAIPISMAWDALDRKNDRFVRLDLMPDAIRNFQKVFTIAWHGFVMLGLLFLLMVGLSYGTLARRAAIDNLNHSIQQKQETISSLQSDLMRVGLLQDQIENYESNLRFLDKYIVDPGKWSRLFSKLAKDFDSVGKIWAQQIESVPQGFRIVGKSQYRLPIPRLAYLLPNPNLKRVVRMVTGEGEMTYEFEMTAGIPQPPSPPSEGAPASASTTVTGTAGMADGKWALEQTGTNVNPKKPASAMPDTKRKTSEKP
jgi:hypothetical protein